jgi:hypothetical protein
MFPLIRFVAFFGGVAAGAQVATHCVRAVKEVCNGRPVNGLIEVADAFAAPILTACTEVSRFGKEVYDAVASPWAEQPNEQRTESMIAQPPNQCCQHAEEGSLNGMTAVAVKG